MASSNNKSTAADTISQVAERQGLLRREVRDLAVVLRVARVAVQHDTRDLVLDGRRQPAHGGRHHSRALAVAAGHNDRVRALGGGQVEEALRFAVSSARSAFGEGVGADGGLVWAADALAGDLVRAVL